MPIDAQRDKLVLRGLVSGNITELTDNEIQVDAKIYKSNLFQSLNKLKRIDTSRLSFDAYASGVFQECIELEYVRLSNAQEISERVFYGCANLQEVSLPSALSLSKLVFRECSALTTLNMPLVTEIGAQCFYQCRALSSMNSPALSVIGNNAFQFCGLVNVMLPSITRIGGNAFSSCMSLDTIDLGASITYIANDALYCPNLLHLVIRNTTQVCTYANVTTSSDPKNSQLKIYVPRTLLDTYKAATNWSRLASKFVALEDHTVDGTTTGELVK